MPNRASTGCYAVDDLRAFTEAVFRAVGVPAGDAAVTTDNLIESNLRGVDSHGITRVLVPYIRRIQKGLVQPVTQVTVMRERPATALLDGGGGLGQVVASRAMRLAIEKARATGAAWVSIRNSNHFGAAGYYASMALDEEMVGMVATNGPAAVAPWGGRQAMLSTNPIAFAVPAGSEPAVVLDMATTVVSRGRINLFARENVEIPPEWALDEEGRPTTNPRAALRGTLRPMAGYKGYGLSLIIELLCGVMTGAGYGLHTGGHLLEYDRPPQNVGSLFCAVSVDSFMDVPDFKARVDTALREIKDSPRAPGFDRIYAPGEIEAETRIERTREGIPISPDVAGELEQLADELGVTFPHSKEDR
jgi:LDH2 family malate/lactate/ureidoglycolate dehydrogenase